VATCQLALRMLLLKLTPLVTMADLPLRRHGRARKADGLLAPGAHNPDITLVGEGLARARDQRVRRGAARPGVAQQLATTLDFDTTDRGHWWGGMPSGPHEQGCSLYG
jgi:hypothetical protein